MKNNDSNKPLKLLFLFGTRPECIKLAPLIKESRQRNVSTVVCFTGQHREMVEPMLKYFDVKPDFDLSIMKPGQTLNDILFEIVSKLTPILNSENPTHVVVQGDTTSAAVGALVSFYKNIPVLHVEAGLRTYNLQSPWPEEFNRRLIALTSSYHFAPTEASAQNLLAEGYSPQTVKVVGNTGIDALRWTCEKENLKIQKTQTSLLQKKNIQILVTLHRRESFGDEMRQVMSAIKSTLEKYPQVHVTWPLHKNPQVRDAFSSVFSQSGDRLNVIDPLGYQDFIRQMVEADFILSDSGGVQEEAPFLGKPVLVCRKNTERPEAVDSGSALLVGTDQSNIEKAIRNLIEDEAFYLKMAQPRAPFGDGYASSKIMDVLK